MQAFVASPHYTAAVFAVIVAVALLVLLRRDQLYVRLAVFWLAVTGAVLVFGLAPGVVDSIGHRLGISYPPIVLVLAGILVLLIKGLASDLATTRMERDLRRLTQHLALLEENLNRLAEKDSRKP